MHKIHKLTLSLKDNANIAVRRHSADLCSLHGLARKVGAASVFNLSMRMSAFTFSSSNNYECTVDQELTSHALGGLAGSWQTLLRRAGVKMTSCS